MTYTPQYSPLYLPTVLTSVWEGNRLGAKPVEQPAAQESSAPRQAWVSSRLPTDGLNSSNNSSYDSTARKVVYWTGALQDSRSGARIAARLAMSGHGAVKVAPERGSGQQRTSQA
jgi:hypothetical protein